MTPLVVENEPPVTFLRRKMTGARFSMGVVIRRYTASGLYTKSAHKWVTKMSSKLTMLSEVL